MFLFGRVSGLNRNMFDFVGMVILKRDFGLKDKLRFLLELMCVMFSWFILL